MCEKLPIITMEWKKPIKIESEDDDSDEPNLVYSMDIRMKCKRKFSQGKRIATAHAPRFPKVKDESWWILLGDIKDNKLHAMKRISIRDGGDYTHTNLKFYIEDDKNAKLNLYLISDCYLGLDQQYEIII